MLRILKNSTYVQAKKSAIIKKWSNEKDVNLDEKCKFIKNIIKQKIFKN